MDKLTKLLIIAILAILKLVITGICLAIGFKIGAMIMHKHEKAFMEKQAATIPG